MSRLVVQYSIDYEDLDSAMEIINSDCWEKVNIDFPEFQVDYKLEVTEEGYEIIVSIYDKD